MSTSSDPSRYEFSKMLNLNDPNDLLENHPNKNIPLLEAGAKAAAEATSEAIKANFMVNNAERNELFHNRCRLQPSTPTWIHHGQHAIMIVHLATASFPMLTETYS